MSRLTDKAGRNNESGSGGARRGFDRGLGRALLEPDLFYGGGPMRYGVVKDTFWTDPKIDEASPDAKFLLLHLLTCPELTICGLVKVTLGMIGYRLGMDRARASTTITELESAGIIKFDSDNSVFWIANYLKHNPPTGPKQIAGYVNCLNLHLFTHLHADAEGVFKDYQRTIQGVSDGQSMVNHSSGTGSGTRTGTYEDQEDTTPDRPEAERLCRILRDGILDNRPNAKVPTPGDPGWTRWVADMDLMLRRDGRTEDEAAAVIRWATADDFWKSNILSPSKLRKQYDRLALQMRRPATGGRKDHTADTKAALDGALRIMRGVK